MRTPTPPARRQAVAVAMTATAAAAAANAPLPPDPSCFTGDVREAYAFVEAAMRDDTIRIERCVTRTIEGVPKKATAALADCFSVCSAAMQAHDPHHRLLGDALLMLLPQGNYLWYVWCVWYGDTQTHRNRHS